MVRPDPGDAAPLPRPFYDRPTARVARELLGARLARRMEAGWRLARIVETEAYVGSDPASHAYRGETPRNRSMFLAPGTLYVYRIHQVHCANVTTRRGQAVLLRAAEPLSPDLGDLRGPGRLCRGFGLTRRDDGCDLVTGTVRLLPRVGPRLTAIAAPRVGIRKATDRMLRFAVRGNPWVSSPRPWGRAGRGA
ncbi:MAG TPA: DNA-3-methyladenine glycosylase [Thermoplasmata archaeon]|nr:DNA-3-methyladenine glycosylase [Thermoplasmata archaeon]